MTYVFWSDTPALWAGHWARMVAPGLSLHLPAWKLLLISKLVQGQSEPNIVKYCSWARASNLQIGWTEEEYLRPLCHICLKSSSCNMELQGLSNAGSLSLLWRSHCAKLVGGYSRSPRFMSKPFPGELPSYLSARRGICYGLNVADSRLTEI